MALYSIKLRLQPLFLTPALRVFCSAIYVDMGLTQLHLVDRNGQDLAAATRDAVNDAYRWAVVEFPNLDQAAVAGWAEDLGKAMAAIPAISSFLGVMRPAH